MKDLIRKITDIITIVGPAIIGVLVALDMNNIVIFAENAYSVVLLILSALSSVASVVFNVVTDVKTKLPEDCVQ